uniref:Polygalacturonase n=1 Tax=Chenopodium quinoa TaxID=63459 RepID=A0A803L4K5_CHEQI
MAYIIKVSMFLTMFSLCSIFSLIQGRILTSMPLNEPYKNSQISIPPSQAPNVNSPKPPSYIDASPAPSPSYVNRGSSSNSTIVQANVFDVRSYGAIGDGLTDDTLAFKSAWDGACQVDNAKVVAPRGFSFMLQPLVFTGPCKSAIVFQLEGTIMPPDGPESWPKNSSKRQWLIFYRIHGLTLQGGGLIDGRGDKWWNLPCKPHKGINGTTLPGPCDSPVVSHKILWEHKSNVERAKNHEQSTIPYSCRFMSKCDDCISIGANTHNLDIRNVTCGPSHGISIGSLGVHNSKACVSNITVSNCMIKHSDNGVRIKTWQGGFGSVTGVTFEAIHMDTVRNPIIIDQYYCLSSNCSNQTAAISISDISYSNIKGTYDPRTPPVHLACSDAVPCTNITVSGLELLPAATATTTMTNGHKRKMEPFCWNAYGSNVGDLTTPPIYCLLEGLPYLDVGSDVGQC